jgi:O-antigen/teichoic acid export membrane protein
MSEAPARPKSGLITGVAWMMGFRLFDRAAGFLSIMVLARLLLPEHFGVVALASGVVAFIELLASMGLDTILIQKRDIERDHYDTAWTIQLSIAVLCALLLCAAAHPAALFFREPRLEPVAYALALGLLFDGLVNIRIVNFRRDMRFDLEFRFMATRRLVALVITITAALVLRNEWALAIGTVSSRATGMVMSYVMIREWPRLTLSKRAELLGKSSWLFLSNIVLFARQRAAEFTIGRVVGSTAVGAYLLASDLANTLSQELVSPINRVALPDLASQKTPQGIARRFDVLTGQLGLILTPLCFGLSACADLVVGLLFGAKWEASIDVLRVLAIAGWVAGIASNIGIGFLSLGLYRANAAIHAIGAATLLPLLAAGAYFDGTRGAAASVLVANAVTVFASLIVSRRATQYGPLDFARRIGRPVVACIGMYAVILWVGSALPVAWPIAIRLAVEVVAGGAAYLILLGALFALSRDPDAAERLAFRLLGQLVGRLRGRPA